MIQGRLLCQNQNAAMAALLKKRALAEYSQVIQEEAVKPIKKLRLVQRPSEPEIQLNLQGLTSHEALQALLKFESSLPVSPASLGLVVRELLDHYEQEKEAVVRGKVATVLGELSKMPGVGAESISEELVALLEKEESKKAKSQVISALCVIGQSAISQTSLHRQLVTLAIENLTNDSHLVRSSCLHLIGCLESCDQPKGDNSDSGETNTQKIVQNFFQDQNPRVRSSAFEALLHFHERGLSLSQGVYQETCTALSDDYEGVRMAAVELIWVLSHTYPDSMVSVPGSDEEIRLIDDGFVKICNMINDISVRVRTKAASLLGSLHLVSSKFLEQTLDKKLMSNMRRKRSAAERARDNYESGCWSTGKKWADDAPKEELDPSNVSLMSIGACGAFVHGLEDEFSEVRNCSLDSMCELASHSPAFASLCQDSIADMFNDEIESVRLNAINSLKKLSAHLELREDQLDIMLGVLQDFSYESRVSLRNMLCEMRLATKGCLNVCVVALLENLRRYPQDRLNIWKCMQHLGQNSPNLALPLMPEFLCLHPYFDTPEPEMDDPAYISILVLVFNAAAGNKTALPMFQEHTWRHYTYLRDTIPEMVPCLQKSDIVREEKVETQSGAEMTASFIQNTVTRLENLNSLDTKTAKELLETAVRDLQRVTELETKTSASAECICLFLQSQLLITQLMSQHAHIVTGSVTVGNLNVLVDKVLDLTNGLQTLFLGLGNAETSLVRQTEVKALTFRLGSTLANSQELATQMKAQEAYIGYLESLQQFLSTSDTPQDSCTSYLLSELPNMRGGKLSSVQHTLHSALKKIRPVACPMVNKIRKAYAVILEPAKMSDNAIKFTAGLTAAVMFVADIENVVNVDNVRIQVKYPDTSTVLIVPASTDVRRQSVLRHRLTSNVLLSHSHWSESCAVEIGLVILSSAVQMKFKSQTSQEREEEERVIELCKPVKVLISPKPHKR